MKKRIALISILMALVMGHLSFAQTTNVRPQRFSSSIRLRPSPRPASPDLGTLYLDESDHKIYFWDGNTWAEIGLGGGSTAPVNATYVVTSSNSVLTNEVVVTLPS